jgi:hypothetical protein
MPFMTLVGKADALVTVGRVSEAEELVTTTLAQGKGRSARLHARRFRADSTDDSQAFHRWHHLLDNSG